MIGIKKKIVFPTVIALSILVIGILSSANVKAQDISNYPPIVQKIADKFDLNISDVQDVFDEDRDERRAEMYASFADRLDELVLENKITDSQKEAILEKHEEIHDRIEELDTLDPDKRREEMHKIQEEFRAWIKEQGFNMQYFGYFGKAFGVGFKARHRMVSEY